MTEKQRGDDFCCEAAADGFEAFYARARGVCMAYLRRRYAAMRLALYSTSQLEEALHTAVEDALFTAWRLWETYDERRASRLTWVTCMARNSFLRVLSMTYQAAVRVHPMPLETLHGVAASDDMQQVVDRQTVVHLFEHMAPQQAQALELHYVYDLFLRQVAEHMGTTTAAVQSLVQRGKESARRQLAEDDGGESNGRQAV